MGLAKSGQTADERSSIVLKLEGQHLAQGRTAMPESISVKWNAFVDEFHRRGIEKIHAKAVESDLITAVPHKQVPEALAEQSTWKSAFRRREATTLLAYLLFAWGMWWWERTSNHAQVREGVAKAARAYFDARSAAIRSMASGELEEDDATRVYLAEEEPLVRLIIEELTTPRPGGDATAPVAAQGPPIPVAADKAAQPRHDRDRRSLLLDCMDGEAALSNSSARALLKHSGAVRDRCEKLLENDLIAAGASGGGIRGLLRKVLEVHQIYYSRVEEVADAVRRVDEGTSAVPALDGIIATLKSTQTQLKSDVYASELAPYRVALTALRKWQSGNGFPDVRFDLVRVTYIYPFTTDRVLTDLQEFVGSLYLACKSGSLAGVRPLTPHEVRFTDLWTWGGQREELQPSEAMPLPSLKVKIPDDEGAPVEYDAELRFTELGNHYLRVETELRDPTMNHINQNIRRGSQFTGGEHVTSDGGKWDSLADYAGKILGALSCRIRETAKHATAEFNINRDHHAVVSIRAASVWQQGGDHRDATRDEIQRVAGPLLLQPVNRDATTLREWMCWETMVPMPNLLGVTAFPSDFAWGTDSATVLCMPSTPDWAHSSYHELAEFVATLPTLVRCWGDDLNEKFRRAERMLLKKPDDKGSATDEESSLREHERLSHPDEAGCAAGQELAGSPVAHRTLLSWERLKNPSFEDELERMRFELHNTIEQIRARWMYLDPSQLLQSAPQKAFLANLYMLPRITDEKTKTDAHLQRADTVVQRIATRETRIHDQRIRRYQNFIQWTLLFVSLFSFSSVLTLALQILYGEHIAGWFHEEARPHEDAIWLVAVYFVLGLILVAIFIITGRIFDRRSKAQRG
jgi:hypothetical protein